MFEKLLGSIRLLLFAFFLISSADTKEEPCCRIITESHKVQWEEHNFCKKVVSDKG